MMRKIPLISVILPLLLIFYSERYSNAEPLCFLNEWDVANSLDARLYKRLSQSNYPAQDGALGKNRSGYFYVRFQMDTACTVIRGIQEKNTGHLDRAIKALEYAFTYQNKDGSFQIHVPPEYRKTPTQEDLADGVAFFLADAGRSLDLLESSEWFKKSDETCAQRERIARLRGKVSLSLQWLKNQVAILRAYDDEPAPEQATNRLFFDAAAFYLTGKWLKDISAMNLGKDFVYRALRNQNSSGAFLEKGGTDSSYQSVSLFIAAVLFTHTQEKDMRRVLSIALSKGAAWLHTRVLPTGELRTQHNTRVYPGGEEFLGREKSITYKNALFALYYYAVISGDISCENDAKKIYDFYDARDR